MRTRNESIYRQALIEACRKLTLLSNNFAIKPYELTAEYLVWARKEVRKSKQWEA